ADRGNDTHAADDDSSHYVLALSFAAGALVAGASLSLDAMPQGRSGARLLLVQLRVGEQAHAQILGFIDQLTVSLYPAIGDAQRQARAHHPLDVDTIFHQLDVIGHLAGELDL